MHVEIGSFFQNFGSVFEIENNVGVRIRSMYIQ